MTAPAQTDPDGNAYTGNSPGVTFTLAPFTVEPSVCTITYSCALEASSPRADICVITAGSTATTFDTATGDYTFESIDNIGFPPGAYVF